MSRPKVGQKGQHPTLPPDGKDGILVLVGRGKEGPVVPAQLSGGDGHFVQPVEPGDHHSLFA